MPSNANFSTGSASYASRENQMKAYDRLPRSVRSALQNASFDWAAYPIRRWFEGGRYTAKELVRLIQEWDADQIKKDRTRVWKLH